MTIKLLLADDSATMQKVVGLAFSDEDIALETVSSGYAAVSSAQTFKPDIVLANVVLPGSSGYEVCERIKEDPELSDTPVILLVGALESFDEAEAARVRCDGHLSKPLDTSELIQMVHALVEKKKESHENMISAESFADGDPALNSPVKKMRISAVKPVEFRVRESFLGPDRILELFDEGTLASAEAFQRRKGDAGETIPAAAGGADHPSEDFVNLVVDRVVRQLSQDVIREVAWEVVPELSEVLIRRFIEEHHKA
jgi:CheY-like chemotaxis protein